MDFDRCNEDERGTHRIEGNTMIRIQGSGRTGGGGAWQGHSSSIVYDGAGVRECLRRLDRPCYIVRSERGVGATWEGRVSDDEALGEPELMAVSPPVSCIS